MSDVAQSALPALDDAAAWLNSEPRRAPPDSGAAVPFVVRRDGMSPGAARGVDIDEAGEGVVSEPRMYQMIRRRGSATPHTFKIAFLDAGVRAYVFTFG